MGEVVRKVSPLPHVPNIPENWSFIIELPPRRDDTTVIEKSWKAELPGGLNLSGPKFSFPEGLDVNAKAQWLEESLLFVRLAVSGPATGECARCLANAELAISDELMYLYHLRGLELGKDTKLQTDDGFMPVEVEHWGRTISLVEQVWETFLAILPAKFLCRDDCAGLCQNCGNDLNNGLCSCEPMETDLRFEALRGISFAEEPNEAKNKF